MVPLDCFLQRKLGYRTIVDGIAEAISLIEARVSRLHPRSVVLQRQLA